jgi:hypothetical protein
LAIEYSRNEKEKASGEKRKMLKSGCLVGDVGGMEGQTDRDKRVFLRGNCIAG